jgi:hypothetical protein
MPYYQEITKNRNSKLLELIVTDSIPLKKNKIRVVSCAPLFCRSYAHGAPQQFHQWKIFNVTRRLKVSSQKTSCSQKSLKHCKSVKQVFFYYLYIFTMKSITIKGSERKWEKLRLKPYVMLERFLALYTEEINQFIFQQKQKCSKTWFTPNAHTVVIELANGKSFDAILQDIQVHGD